jgi:hypothetical protein
MANQVDIKYLNKDFASLKADLIEYARAYYPTVYNDFTQASPGTMFIDMASYVGDILSFYLDNQLQETFLQYAKQRGNLFTLAYMLGYRPKVTSAAIVNLDVYQELPAITSGGDPIPDFSKAMTIEQGMQVKSNVNSSVVFYVPQKVDFTTSSSLDPTTIEVYTLSGNNPATYLLKKTVQAISGQIKNQSFSFSSPQRFSTVNISDSSIITILSAKDSDGYTWYEVPYLAQDYILKPVQNTAANYPSLYQFQNQVPYMIRKEKVERRFVSRFKTDGSLEIEFGSGINSIVDTGSLLLPDPNSVSVGLTGGGLSTLSSSFDPTNFVTTRTYGLAPKNTTITFQYLVGGGAGANALSNQLTQIVSYTVTGDLMMQDTIVVNNPDPASGGGDGDTVDELRMNIGAEFSTQYRAVTQEDYLARTLSMPAQYGKISKAYITKDDATFNNYMQGDISQKDQVLVSLYVLGLDANNNLADPSPSLLQNLQTYLSDYRMMTDAINIKPAYVINIGCNFDIIIRPNYTSQDVIARCILALQNYFNIDNWSVNEPIILGDVYSLLDVVEGVQTVKDIRIVNKTGEVDGYSKYSYDISAGSLNGVIYPSLDPSIFELKFPNTDIQGRVVTM